MLVKPFLLFILCLVVLGCVHGAAVLPGKDEGEDNEDGADDVKEKSAEEEAGLVLEHHNKAEHGPYEGTQSNANGHNKVDSPY